MVSLSQDPTRNATSIYATLELKLSYLLKMVARLETGNKNTKIILYPSILVGLGPDLS